MKKKAVAQNMKFCCMAALGSSEEKLEQFWSSWSGKVSPLVWRVPILIWAVVVISFSISSFWGPLELYMLYMTHWGLVMIIVEAIFGIIVVIKKPNKDEENKLHNDATFGLPWYVKTYWVLYNISIPVAFLVTIFYWGLLKKSGRKVNYAPNPVMDMMLHGANSLAMLVELVASAQPSRVLHVMQPLYFALAYLLFTVCYYLAGGHDPWGNEFIYPVIDWSKPRQTLVVATITALVLAVLHLAVVAIATARDCITARCQNNATGVYNDAFDA